MTSTERASFAAELAVMSGDALQTLLSNTSVCDEPERRAMIKAEVDKVWEEYCAEMEALEVRS